MASSQPCENTVMGRESATSLELHTHRQTADRVLWIDDEVRSDDAAVLLMRAEGLQLEVANSALDGLERAATREFAAIILDVRLPDINGLDVLERLRDIAPTAAIMVLSGYIDVADAGRAVRLGVRDVRTNRSSAKNCRRRFAGCSPPAGRRVRSCLGSLRRDRGTATMRMRTRGPRLER